MGCAKLHYDGALLNVQYIASHTIHLALGFAVIYMALRPESWSSGTGLQNLHAYAHELHKYPVVPERYYRAQDIAS